MGTPFLLFFIYFGALVTVGVALFLVGELLLRAVGIRTVATYTSIVRNIFVGYILITTIYALYSTRFVSVNVVYLLLLICAAIEVKRNRASILDMANEQRQKLNPLVVVSLLLAVFSWSWFSIYNPDSILHFNSFGDNILYSKISRSLAETGFENGFYCLNDFDSFYHGPEPYHYFELWGGALVAAVLPLPHYGVLQLVIYPLFFFLAALCLYSQFTRGHALLIAFVSFLLLFISGYYAPLYEQSNFLGLLRNFSFNTLTPWANKLSFFYVFILCAYLLYARGFRSLSILCLLGLTVANIISLPIVFVSLFTILGLMYYWHRDARAEVGRQLLYVVLSTLLIVIFYSVFQRKSSGLAGVEITSPVKLLLESLINADFTTQRNILIGGLLHLSIFYLPLLPLFLLFVRITEIGKSNVLIFFAVLGVTIILVSLIGWALLFREINSFEVFIVVVIPFLNCAFAIMVITILNNLGTIKQSKAMNTVTLSLVCLVIVQQIYNSLPDERIRSSNRYSTKYLSEISALITSASPKRGGSIKDRSMLEEPHLKFNAVYPMGEYLTLMDESIAVVNMGDFNTPIDSSSAMNLQRNMKAVSSGLFFRYATTRAGLHPLPEEIDALQKSFVQDNKIDFLILSRDASFPQSLLPYATKPIVDLTTGERFVLLKRF